MSCIIFLISTILLKKRFVAMGKETVTSEKCQNACISAKHSKLLLRLHIKVLGQMETLFLLTFNQVLLEWLQFSNCSLNGLVFGGNYRDANMTMLTPTRNRLLTFINTFAPHNKKISHFLQKYISEDHVRLYTLFMLIIAFAMILKFLFLRFLKKRSGFSYYILGVKASWCFSFQLQILF